MIRLSEIRFDEHAERAVVEVLRSGQLAQGPTVERFEEALRARLDVAHVAAVSSGTAALVLALEAAGVGPGHEVVTSPFTFAATVNAILHVGATVRFADIDPEDFTVNVEAVDAAINERTAAVLPVDLYGQPADIPALAALAARRGIRLIEDAAQAFGAEAHGTPAGTADVGCFSFYATKPLTTGEGGAVATADGDLDGRVRLLRSQGSRVRYRYEAIGHNMRMTELAAAVGRCELDRFDELTGRRQVNAALLTAGLESVPGIQTPLIRAGRTHVFHQYTVRVTEDSRLSRDALREQLAAEGIETGVHYPRAATEEACYGEHSRVICERMPHAETAARQVLSLPVHPWLTDGDIERIVAAISALEPA